MRPTFLVLALAFCLSAQAQYLTEQKNHISLTSGVNINNRDFFGLTDINFPGIEVEYTNTANFEIGLFYEKVFKNNISLKTGLTFVSRDYFSENEINNGTGFIRKFEVFTSYNYLDASMHLQWYFYQNEEKGIFLNVTTGPTLSILLSEYRKEKEEYQDGSERISNTRNNEPNPKLDGMPSAFLGVGFTKVFLQKEKKSFYVTSNIYAQTFFAEHIEGKEKYQFGLNVGVGMAL